MSNSILFSSATHLRNMGSWKAGSPTSNPQRLKAESQQFFVNLQQSHLSDNRDQNEYPVIQSLDTTTLSFASMMQPKFRAGGAYCCSRAKNHSNPSLIHNSNIDPGDFQAGLWLPTRIIHPCLTDSLISSLYSWMSLQKNILGIWGDGFLKQISMPHISCQSHLENISSWKAGSPASNPRRLKPSFAAVIEEQSVYCNNSWRPQLRDQTLCFSAWDWSFFCSCNEGMGMMQQECRTGGAHCGF